MGTLGAAADVAAPRQQLEEYFQYLLQGYALAPKPELVFWRGQAGLPDPSDRRRPEGISVAYTTVGRKFYALKGALVARPQVVVSEDALLSLSETQRRAVIAHELGHAIDFVAFGQHYKLTSHADALIGDQIEARSLDCSSDDPEERADIIANRMVLPRQSRPFSSAAPSEVAERSPVLVYDKRSNLMQTLVTEDEYRTAKERKSLEGDSIYADHFPHDPVSGSVSALDFSVKSHPLACPDR